MKQIPSQQGAALQRILNAGSAESSSCDILPIKWWVVYTKLVLSAAIYACITSFGSDSELTQTHTSGDVIEFSIWGRPYPDQIEL